MQDIGQAPSKKKRPPRGGGLLRHRDLGKSWVPEYGLVVEMIYLGYIYIYIYIFVYACTYTHMCIHISLFFSLFVYSFFYMYTDR